jgi:hypothetical protein
MKALILTLTITLLAASANAKPFSFKFKPANAKSFSITQSAGNQHEAFKLAAKECFKKLTGNRYPGEEKGLEIIDICANPKM